MSDHRKARLLALVSAGTGVWDWEEQQELEVEARFLQRPSRFAKGRTDVKTVVFRMEPNGIGMHNAIWWDGKHHLITAIDHSGAEGGMLVTGVQLQPRACTAKRLTHRVDQQKRPVGETEVVARFPGILVEHKQEVLSSQPMVQVGYTYLLLAPKPVELGEGDLVYPEGLGRCTIKACHKLDQYKNSYETLCITEL